MSQARMNQARPLRAVITAGGTEEPVDDVRVLTNFSTGRFGAAIARALEQASSCARTVAHHGASQ